MRLSRPRRAHALPSGLLLALMVGTGVSALAQSAPPPLPTDPITGTRSRLTKDWVGLRPLPPTTPILVMAGHADSQGVGGAGTSGAAVARRGQRPMDPSMTDELFWNLRLAQAVVSLGQARGLAISFYDPPQRSIADPNDPRTTWSVGRAFVASGGYALEIHHDAYGPDGIGSGLIPPMRPAPSRMDESLADAFGAYPFHFRNGLGAPKRGIAILEIGKLEAPLEPALRDPLQGPAVINALALRIVEAMIRGLTPTAETAVTQAATPSATQTATQTVLNGPLSEAATAPGASLLSPQPGGEGSDLPARRRRASSGGG